MNKIALLLLCLFSITCFAYIDPTLDAQRRAFLPSFLQKITENEYYALNNLTVHATSDYCWNNEYSGSFCQAAAIDYVYILLTPEPFYNATSGQTVYIPINVIGMKVLSVDLVDDGVLNDTYSLRYILNNTEFNSLTFSYDIQDGLFYTAYYVFKKGSALVSSETVTSADGAKFVTGTTTVVDITQLCFLLINYACLPGSIYQEYATYDDCISVMTAINAQNAAKRGGGCPDPQVSNTTTCRYLHAAVALVNPPQSQACHCPHAGNPSTICIDYCDSVCDFCDVNAKCNYDVNQYGTRSYSCSCNTGYTGDGYNCTKTTCTAQYQCATNSNYNYVGCNTTTNTCYCQDTFIWNATLGGCVCPTGNSVFYTNSGTAVCLETGRCIDKYQCTTNGTNSAGQPQPYIGNWNQVNCVAYGPLTTLFPYSTCVCNYGYTGGFFLPCVCPSGRTEVWSSTINGNVCLASGQCTADYNCASGQHCNFSAGPSAGVGVCA